MSTSAAAAGSNETAMNSTALKLVFSSKLRGIYKLETQRTANCVPINSAAKHIEHNGEVHRGDVTFQRLGFTNNETQRRPGVQLTGTRLAYSAVYAMRL